MTITQINTAAQPSVIAPKPKNALVHGVYATDITLPWESGDNLEQLPKTFARNGTRKGQPRRKQYCRYAGTSG